MIKEELKLRPDEYPEYKHGFLAGYAGEDLKGGESLATFSAISTAASAAQDQRHLMIMRVRRASRTD
jgi:hypothetical protein